MRLINHLRGRPPAPDSGQPALGALLHWHRYCPVLTLNGIHNVGVYSVAVQDVADANLGTLTINSSKTFT